MLSCVHSLSVLVFVLGFGPFTGVIVGVYEFLHQVIDDDEEAVCYNARLICLLSPFTAHVHLLPPRWSSGKGVRLESGRPGFGSRFPCGSFCWSSHTSHLKIVTPVATLPGAWRYTVSAGTGRPGVDTL